MSHRSKRHLFKIIVLGNTNVGKTSLMNQFVNKKFSSQYKATIGADFMTKELIIDGSHITLQIWDTTGQERFQSLGVAFYRGADACVLVFDLTNIKSYDSIHVWKDEFLNYAAPKNEKEFPFLLMGNKKDLVEYGTMNRAITASKVLKDFPKIEYIETSAKNGDSVESAFNFMGRICAEQIQEDDVYGVFDNTVDLNNTEHLESSMCNC